MAYALPESKTKTRSQDDLGKKYTVTKSATKSFDMTERTRNLNLNASDSTVRVVKMTDQAEQPPIIYNKHLKNILESGHGRQEHLAQELPSVAGTDVYNNYCTQERQNGLTIPITRVKKYQETSQVETSTWKEKTVEVPRKEVHQIKLECDQKVVVQGQHLKCGKKQVPVTRYTMVCEKVPVKKMVKKLVCVPVIKTIEVETTDIKEIEEEVIEMEEKWTRKEITETKTVDDYKVKPYEKIVTIPYIQECWAKFETLRGCTEIGNCRVYETIALPINPRNH